MRLCFRIEFPTAAMKLVALKLADCANDDGENIYPSVGRIERETGLGASTVRNVLRMFQEAGLLEIVAEAHGNKWGRSTTIRRFDVEHLHDLSAVEVRQGDRRVQRPSTHVIKQVGHGAEARWAVLPRGADDASAYDAEEAPEAKPPLQPLEGQTEATPPDAGACPSSSRRGTPPATGPYPSVRTIIEPLPLTPASGGTAPPGRGNEILDGLKADGRNQHVVEHLIAPLLAMLKPRFPDPLATLIGIRDRLRDATPAELKAACAELADDRVRDFPSRASCIAALKAARTQAKPAGIAVERGSPQFAAWLEHYRADGGWQAAHMATAPVWTVPTEWPPHKYAAATTQSEATGSRATA